MRIMADLLNGYASQTRLQTVRRSEPRNGSILAQQALADLALVNETVVMTGLAGEGD
jgi:hypothetical protein